MLGRMFKRKKSWKRKIKKRISGFFEQRKYPKYLLTEKRIGETPLDATERLRKEHNLPKKLPMAYAGRLDPMASGRLLVLIGKECKKQKKYHDLDKEYGVELLLGVSSDTGDVLGLINDNIQSIVHFNAVEKLCNALEGTITLPYPHFSSKTVKGKPLHMWTLEKKLDEINIPKNKSEIYSLQAHTLRTITKDEIVTTVRKKIETIPKVTDPRKELGADFRRKDVRLAWNKFEQKGFETYQLLSFTCICSSGTYMRSLCEHIAKELGTTGLAYSIHRTKIGVYRGSVGRMALWSRRY